MLIVRELVGGLYFGARGTRDDGTVFDTCEYTPAQVERVARRGFELARSRRGSLVSVDKANVLDTSRLWRRVVTELAADYPDVQLRHALVDSFAMELVGPLDAFDVVVTENMFGDILSDLAAAVTGGLGLAASASLGDAGPGIFEPVHGSAPDIAGTGKANPAAMLRSLALLLEHALGRTDLADSARGCGRRGARVAADARPGRRRDDRRVRRCRARETRGGVMGSNTVLTETCQCVVPVPVVKASGRARRARCPARPSGGSSSGQMSVTVGYLGPRGSHSVAAAAVLVPNATESIDLPSFAAVVEAASSSRSASVSCRSRAR